MPPRSRDGRRRPSRRRKGGGATNIIVGSVLLLLSAGVVGGFVYLKLTTPERPDLVRDTLCPVDGPRSVTVALLDASDEIPSAARQEALLFLSDLAESLPEYGLLELRLLKPQDPVTETVFRKCNPGDGRNLDALVANPERAKRRWSEEFRAPLEAALSRGLSPAAADRSPIMQAIQTIAIEDFSGEARADIPKRLVIVSDMIEHGPDYTQYRGSLAYDRFKRSPAYQKLWTDLKGAAVTIRYVQRLDGRLDDYEHATFWTEWISDNKGRLETIEKLQGAT